MKIISIRRGYECDHSTRDYGYISGIKVFYDYGTFEMTFSLPYNTKLFKLLKGYENIEAEKRFNRIEITVYLYSEVLGEDEYEYVSLAESIREELVKQNIEVIKLLDAYHGEKDEFTTMKPKTDVGKMLQETLTPLY
jgi:hypothetical protein